MRSFICRDYNVSYSPLCYPSTILRLQDQPSQTEGMTNRYDLGEILWRENMQRISAAETARLWREGVIMFLVSAAACGVIGSLALGLLHA